MTALLLLGSCAPRVQRADVPTTDVAVVDETATDVPDPPLDVPRVDTDGDGLCDDTEMVQFQTDPRSVDSDNDGFTDLFEFLSYTNPNRATDPNADNIIPWSERSGELADVVFSFNYRGNGESLFALFSETNPSIDGLRGEDLSLQLQAFSANPPANVNAMIADRFVSVTGFTRLSYRFFGEWPAQAPLRCRRAYTVIPNIYAEARGYVYGRRFFIDVRAHMGDFDAAVDTDASESPRDVPTGDGADVRGPTPSPWPYVARGLCLPEPGHCR